MNANSVPGSATPGQAAGKYLTFVVNRGSYGLPVGRVREIIRPTAITVVPQLPYHVRGVINLRGAVIPVIDLRRKFGVPTDDDLSGTCIIIAQITASHGTPTPMGLVVDQVSEVTAVAAVDIEATPDFGPANGPDFILGMAKCKGMVTPLLDLDRLVAADTVELSAAA